MGNQVFATFSADRLDRLEAGHGLFKTEQTWITTYSA